MGVLVPSNGPVTADLTITVPHTNVDIITDKPVKSLLRHNGRPLTTLMKW